LTGMMYFLRGSILCNKKFAIILKLGSRSSINFNNRTRRFRLDDSKWLCNFFLGSLLKSSSGISNFICKSSNMAFKNLNLLNVYYRHKIYWA
jgi:hypothetical protein